MAAAHSSLKLGNNMKVAFASSKLATGARKSRDSPVRCANRPDRVNAAAAVVLADVAARLFVEQFDAKRIRADHGNLAGAASRIPISVRSSRRPAAARSTFRHRRCRKTIVIDRLAT